MCVLLCLGRVLGWHVLKPETTGTKPQEQPEQESEMTGTTETKIEHDRNNIVEHDRNDSEI